MKQIKKTFVGILLLAIVVIPTKVLAETQVVVSPASQTVSTGSVIKTAITIIPDNERIYTGQIEIIYPPSLLEFESFSFEGGVLAHTAPEFYNTKSGMIVRTAGFPGGTSAPIQFGTATFRAKSAGNAFVVIGANTVILNGSGTNTYSPISSPNANGTITVVGSSASLSSTNRQGLTGTGGAEEELTIAQLLGNDSVGQAESASDITVRDQNRQEAALGGLPVKTALWVLVALAIIGIIVYLMRSKSGYKV